MGVTRRLHVFVDTKKKYVCIIRSSSIKTGYNCFYISLKRNCEVLQDTIASVSLRDSISLNTAGILNRTERTLHTLPCNWHFNWKTSRYEVVHFVDHECKVCGEVCEIKLAYFEKKKRLQKQKKWSILILEESTNSNWQKFVFFNVFSSYYVSEWVSQKVLICIPKGL